MISYVQGSWIKQGVVATFIPHRKEVVVYDEYIPGIVFDDTVWNVRYSSLEF
ncbi:hypothetical protein [Petroclostridium sp. X23]|uniref:hypothetical protein n=1 Tax=Petroclostridium sp. X23 TaxID=3045146 RepID=UPI0024AE1B51|nr:hypothetical protein [Petroclostridium sp. X23]WHH60396.1 hypothetical protein QKW49_06640 [Petroclostridium sp. X23]